MGYKERLIKIIYLRFGPSTPYTKEDLEYLAENELEKIALMDEDDINLY